MAQPTAYEQYMLELINAERAANGAQPLVFNDDLNDAADGHTDWMLATDTFSHTGAGGSSPLDRAKAEGYAFLGSWAVGENIAWVSTGGDPGYSDETAALNENLMNSPEHRANLLNPTFSEIGIGIDVGDYKGTQGAFVTEDFAKSGNTVYLTGVAFNDDGDKAYDVGEGLGGITVTATDSQGNAFTTTTWDAGGYKLPLAAGDYTVTFSKDGAVLSTAEVTIADKNVDLDYIGDGTSAAPVADAASAPASDVLQPTETAQPSETADAGTGTEAPADASAPAADAASGTDEPSSSSTSEDSSSTETASASDSDVKDDASLVAAAEPDTGSDDTASDAEDASESTANADDRGGCGSGRFASLRLAGDAAKTDTAKDGEASGSSGAQSFDHHDSDPSLDDLLSGAWSHSGHAHHDGLWA